MTKLITYAQIAPYKHITSNVNAAKFDIYNLQAQELDLRPLLGTELYWDLVDDFEASPSLVIYSDLYNGSTYVKDTRSFKHEGLIPVMANFIYARYLASSGASSTPWGMVQKKQGDVSDPLSEKSLARMMGQAQSEALAYWERVKIYLCDHTTEIPLYNRKAKSQSGIRIRGVGGNSNDYYRKRNY